MTGTGSVDDPVLAATVVPLDAAGFRYDIHRTPAGEPYAAFRWSTEALPPLTCSVVLYDGAWRLAAHEPAVSIAPEVLTARNGALDVVRGHHPAGEPGLSAVLSVRLRPSRLTADDVADLLVHLAESLAFLVGDREAVPALPQLSAAGTADPADPATAGMTIPAPGWVRVTARAPDLAWAQMSARWALVDQLHDWSPVGTLLPLDSAVGARVTTVSGSLAAPDGPARAAADAERILDAARSGLLQG